MERNKKLAQIFDKMADILEFLGDNPFRIRTYRRVAKILENLPMDIEEAIQTGYIKKVKGIGSSTLEKIQEFLKTGTISKYEELRKKVPEELLELMDIPGVGPKTLKTVYEKLNIRTKEEFLKALKDGSIASLPGFGVKKVEKILKGIELWQKAQERIPLVVAYPLAWKVVEYLKTTVGKYIENITVAGSTRRMKETVRDFDILVSAKRENWKKIHDAFVQYPDIEDVQLHGETKSTILLADYHRQCDLRTVEPESWGAALQYFTGSKHHNIKLREIAKEKGLKINEYGVFEVESGKKIAGKTEEEVYAVLGMQYIPPEIRENTGEIELALKHALPTLVQYDQLRGDLHMHSNWSDGTNTIEEMVKACIAMGYEYMAISDHSQSARVANGLTPERFFEQKKEIERLRKLYGDKIHILWSAEVDILPDGSLDLPDEVLKEFDIVTASIHSRFNQDNTQRIIKAMENPYVNVIGHPFGKQYGYREGYPLDFEKVLQKAKETQTALEINSQREDLDSHHIRQAVQEGVMLVVNSDAHSVGQLWTTKIGLGLARRGWAKAEDILNTRPVEGVLEFVNQKRKLFKVSS
ncbi:MAG: DNA polymerase/3'-5' exonuclease PolX [Aquificae bacterium]|nr:DNA polymerase/3'-5' exonuclease PolX [Aquificota bacterium]